LGIAQLGDGVERAAKFEGPDPLKVFAFAKNRGPGQLVQGARGGNGRLVRLSAQTLARGPDAFK
jgi:hypothetical protein